MGFWPVVEDLLENADILVLVADARMPELSLNKELMKKIEESKKASLVVYNKIDLVSKSRLNKLRKKYDGIFVSGKNNINITSLKRRLQIMAKKVKFDKPRIGIVGYPNMGKSAIINALAHRARAKVEQRPGTTRGVQWVKLGSMQLMDSPGVIPYEDKNLELALLGSKSAEKMKDPVKVAVQIIDDFDKDALKRHYGLDELEEDGYDVLLQIGKKRGYLLKKGEIDEHRAALALIRDWQKGKLKV